MDSVNIPGGLGGLHAVSGDDNVERRNSGNRRLGA